MRRRRPITEIAVGVVPPTVDVVGRGHTAALTGAAPDALKHEPTRDCDRTRAMIERPVTHRTEVVPPAVTDARIRDAACGLVSGRKGLKRELACDRHRRKRRVTPSSVALLPSPNVPKKSPPQQ